MLHENGVPSSSHSVSLAPFLNEFNNIASALEQLCQRHGSHVGMFVAQGSPIEGLDSHTSGMPPDPNHPGFYARKCVAVLRNESTDRDRILC